jgi:hypothetical protein
LATAALGAGVVGGMSFAGPRHDARCQGLHAQAQAWHNAAAGVDEPQKTRYNNRGDAIEARADRCDNQGSTTSSTAP